MSVLKQSMTSLVPLFLEYSTNSFLLIYLIFKSINSGSQIYIQMKSLEAVVCA